MSEIRLPDLKQTEFTRLWDSVIVSEQRYPEPTVGALIFNKDGKLLLVKSHKWLDKYTMPGGHVELGETIKDALKREVKEEVGLDIEIVDMLGFQEAIFPAEFAKRKHFIFFDFIAKCKNDEVTLDKDEIQEYFWIEPKEALKLDLESFIKKTLEKYFKKYPNGFS